MLTQHHKEIVLRRSMEVRERALLQAFNQLILLVEGATSKRKTVVALCCPIKLRKTETVGFDLIAILASQRAVYIGHYTNLAGGRAVFVGRPQAVEHRRRDPCFIRIEDQ